MSPQRQIRPKRPLFKNHTTTTKKWIKENIKQLTGWPPTAIAPIQRDVAFRCVQPIEFRHFSCPFVSPSAREMPPSKSTFWKEKRKKKKKNGRHLCPFMLYRILLFISSIKKIIIKKSGEPVRVTKIWWFIISQKWIHFNEDICIPATEWNNEHLTINRFPICYSHKGFVFLSNILNFFF